ncbi:MAG: UDP-glucose 4-epimerase GalE [Clostridia bacterium]|nr:UDP-glucose 4-epimerase GalE [Clostridia bacterium]
MNILVTGAAGYIGSHTCVELLNNGYDVISLDNYSNSSPKSLERVEEITSKSIKKYECDLRDVEGIEKIFEENKIDAVIHFAGLKAVGESCKIPFTYYENNVSGTVNLCQVMAKMGCKKLVFSSSATVYGGNDIPYVETFKTGVEISSPYGRTKFMIEEILKDAAVSDNEWKISLLRYFNPIGAHPSGKIGEDPRGIPNNLMPYISQVAIGKLKELSVFGDDYETKDGTCVRDYIHVCDLARGHLLALERLQKDECEGVEMYNLGAGKGYSVLEVISAFEKASGKTVNRKFAPRREGDLPEFYADAKKAKEYLGFETELGIDKMCEDTWRWQQNNPKGYE